MSPRTPRPIAWLRARPRDRTPRALPRPTIVQTLVGLSVALALVTTLLAATPSGTASARLLDPEVTEARPPAAPATQPESGPQLTRAAWREAIGRAVVDAGATRLGTPYVYGAAGPSAFDCSGFTRWAWAQLGVDLPHYTGAQWAMVDPIPLDRLQPGDLVFDWSGGGDPAHVGLYVGDGMMIHAPNSGGVVRYDPIGWWTGATVAAGRIR